MRSLRLIPLLLFAFVSSICAPAQPFFISRQPENLTMVPGSTAVFFIRTSTPNAPGGDSYQWFFNGQIMPGEVGPTLSIANIQTANAGSYTAVVTNNGSTETSTAATLTIVLPAGVLSFVPDTHSVTFLRADGTLWSAGETATNFLAEGAGTNVQLSPKQIQNCEQVVSFDGSRFLKTDGTLWWTKFVEKKVGTYNPLRQAKYYYPAAPFQYATGAVSIQNIKSDSTWWSASPTIPGFISTPIFSGVTSGSTKLLRIDRTLWDVQFAGYVPGPTSDTTVANYNLVPIADHVASSSWDNSNLMFLKSDGSLWAMGKNDFGQLGDGTNTDRNSPVQVATAVASAQFAGGDNYYIKSDRSLWATGKNDFGQLGDGTTMDRSVPVQIATAVDSINYGYNRCFIFKSDGSLWAMGRNNFGQLGDGTKTDRSTPVQVFASGVSKVVVSGPSATHFLKTDGTWWATGYNGEGLLGDGTTIDRSSPVQVSTGVVLGPWGQNNNFVLRSDGSLWGSGKNDAGQLGDGTKIDRPSLVLIASGSMTRPSAPTLVTASDGNFRDYTLITWKPTINTSAYEVWRSTRNDPTTSIRVASDLSASLYQDVPPVLGAPYYYWIKATNYVGGSDLSLPDEGTAVAATYVKSRSPDFNHDRRTDLLWSNSITGERSIALMDGTSQIGYSFMGNFLPEWSIAATGDFNGDGKTDIVWSSNVSGERALWLMNGTNLLGISTLGIFPLEWTVAATGDFNLDGKPDIVWSNSITGERAIWLMNGTSLLGVSTLGIFPLEWTVAATGDFNFDGKPDIVWSNSITGERALWLMDGTRFLGVATLGIFPLEWTVSGVGDYNGDGKPDIIWSNSTTGEHALWMMNGTQFLYATSLGVYPLEWSVKN